MSNTTTICLLSGGLDSATATAIAIEAGHQVIGLSFNYGQRHNRELIAASQLAKYFNLIEHQIVDIDLSTWGGSSLTDMRKALPINGVVEGLIPNTYVPGRNTVFIAIGLSFAEARGANQLVLGVNAMDYSGYPDCRADYIDAFQKLANLSNKIGREGNGIKLWTPLIYWEKVKIIEEALRLGVPIQSTWSCYSENNIPCGKCDSCRIRNLALRKAGRPDLCNL